MIRLQGPGHARHRRRPRRATRWWRSRSRRIPLFRREGDDIIVDAAGDAAGGGAGRNAGGADDQGPGAADHSARIPGRGTRLRLRGRGIEGTGHQFVELHPVLPPAEEPELAEFLKTWKPRHPIDPRAGMETD